MKYYLMLFALVAGVVSCDKDEDMNSDMDSMAKEIEVKSSSLTAKQTGLTMSFPVKDTKGVTVGVGMGAAQGPSTVVADRNGDFTWDFELPSGYAFLDTRTDEGIDYTAEGQQFSWFIDGTKRSSKGQLRLHSLKPNLDYGNLPNIESTLQVVSLTGKSLDDCGPFNTTGTTLQSVASNYIFGDSGVTIKDIRLYSHNSFYGIGAPQFSYIKESGMDAYVEWKEVPLLDYYGKRYKVFKYTTDWVTIDFHAAGSTWQVKWTEGNDYISVRAIGNVCAFTNKTNQDLSVLPLNKLGLDKDLYVTRK